MIPFLHLGPLTIPTFGLMVATGLLAAAYLLQADFDRRREQFLRRGYLKGSGQPGHHDEGFVIIGSARKTRNANDEKCFIVMDWLAATLQIAAPEELLAAAVKVCLQEVRRGQRAGGEH